MHEVFDVHKAPEDFTFVTYLWVALLSIWGGVANYVGKLKRGDSRFNILEIFGEMLVSGFAGLMTFYVCYAVHTPEVVTAVAVGISGHMGARIITQLEGYIAKKFNLPRNED